MSGRSDLQHSNTDGFSFSVRLVQPHGKRDAENHTLDAAPESNITSLEFAGFSGEAPPRGPQPMKSLQNSKSMIQLSQKSSLSQKTSGMEPECSGTTLPVLHFGASTLHGAEKANNGGPKYPQHGLINKHDQE